MNYPRSNVMISPYQPAQDTHTQGRDSWDSAKRVPQVTRAELQRMLDDLKEVIVQQVCDEVSRAIDERFAK